MSSHDPMSALDLPAPLPRWIEPALMRWAELSAAPFRTSAVAPFFNGDEFVAQAVGAAVRRVASLRRGGAQPRLGFMQSAAEHWVAQVELPDGWAVDAWYAGGTGHVVQLAHGDAVVCEMELRTLRVEVLAAVIADLLRIALDGVAYPDEVSYTVAELAEQVRAKLELECVGTSATVVVRPGDPGNGVVVQPGDPEVHTTDQGRARVGALSAGWSLDPEGYGPYPAFTTYVSCQPADSRDEGEYESAILRNATPAIGVAVITAMTGSE